MGTDKRARQKAGRQLRIEAAIAEQRRAKVRSQIIRVVVIAAIFAAVVGFATFARRDDNKTVESGASSTTLPTTASTASTVPGSAPAEVPAQPPGAQITGDTPCPAPDGSAARTTSFAKAPPNCIDPAKTYVATFDTTKGVFKVKLDPSRMPSTTNNFVVLSRYHYYDGTALFRIAPSIAIIQGGSPTTNSASDPGPGYTIPDEGGTFDAAGTKGPFTYKEGQLVMARSQGPNSSGAQFFLTTGPEVAGLDTQGTYLLFGEVTEGLDVLKQIAALYVPFPPSSPMAQLGGGPKEPVVINSVTITES